MRHDGLTEVVHELDYGGKDRPRNLIILRTNYTATVRVDGEYVKKKLTGRFVKQGNVLSPGLFHPNGEMMLRNTEGTERLKVDSQNINNWRKATDTFLIPEPRNSLQSILNACAYETTAKSFELTFGKTEGMFISKKIANLKCTVQRNKDTIKQTNKC